MLTLPQHFTEVSSRDRSGFLIGQLENGKRSFKVTLFHDHVPFCGHESQLF